MITTNTNTNATTTPTTRAALGRAIRADWSAVVQAALNNGLPRKVARLALKSLPKGTLRLAGTSAKVEKGADAQGVLPGVVYLGGASAHAALCKWATPGCIATCLGEKSGRLAFKTGRPPQAWKTALFLGAYDSFLALALFDMGSLARKARALGAQAALRFDGASDTGVAQALIPHAQAQGVQLWDYTKSIGRAQAQNLPGDTWHVTLSYPGKDKRTGRPALTAPYIGHVVGGGSCAVVVDVPKGKALPTTWWGLPAIDGDLSDLRFLDPKGVVVLLRTKGSKRNARAAKRTGFALSV